MREKYYDKLKDIILSNIENQDNLDLSNINELDPIGSGMDSITFVRIVVFIEEEFKISIPNNLVNLNHFLKLVSYSI